MIQVVAAVLGHVQIFKTVVVVVSDGDSHAIADALQTGLLGDIFEAAVLALVVKPVPVRRRLLLGNRPLRHGIAQRGAVHEKQIQPAVIVEVERRDA